MLNFQCIGTIKDFTDMCKKIAGRVWWRSQAQSKGVFSKPGVAFLQGQEKHVADFKDVSSLVPEIPI
jgi:hypothetical protein